MEKKIGLFVGSLRKESYTRKLANCIVKMAPEGFNFQIIEIGQLPLYNQDFDDHHEVPESYEPFRNCVGQLDGVIFLTPEYNRSVPAVLKNALDVASRPYGKNMWNAKPGAVISVSPGNLSGFGANHHLRQSLVFLNVWAMQQPEAYLGHISNETFGDNDTIQNDSTREFVQKIVDAYIAWFKQLTK